MLNYMWGVLTGWVSMILILWIIGLFTGSHSTTDDDEGE